VSVTRFAAQDSLAKLGHGPVDVKAGAGGTLPAADTAIYEAAVVDQLAKAGYDTAKADPAGGQIAEISISRDVAVPEEAPHKPVSGETSIGMSNHGSMVGLALAIDLSKPKKAIMATKLNVRLKDRASGAVLWEGRASIETREGDKAWPDETVAARLSAALFDHYNDPKKVQIVAVTTP
jgi:hypothetical protein